MIAGDTARDDNADADGIGLTMMLAQTSRQRLGRNARSGATAFTLIEILIVVVILGILAAIVIPHFSNASALARENTMKDELRYLRTQVIVFKAQHDDVSPGYPSGDTTQAATGSDFTDQMTQYTTEKCDVSSTASATYKLGPYLSQMPGNPVSGLSTVKVVTNDPKDASNVDGTTGWIYNPLTLEVVANLRGNGTDGVAYADY